MAVVINEFEVVDTPPVPARAADATDAPPTAPALPDPADLRRLQAVAAELLLRRLAH